MTDEELLNPKIVTPAQVSPLSAEIQLTEEQQTAIELILAWVKKRIVNGDRSKLEFRLGGYAGTGKTTVAKHIIKAIREQFHLHLVVSAFTGKAVNVLQRKGIVAQTLHSLMYECEIDPDTGAFIAFHKRSYLVDSPKLIIVDEASMVSTELYNDLKSYNLLLLFIGDPGQLEPVGDNPNLMATTDFTLTHIHRQAALSPILTLADSVRKGGRIDLIEKEGLIVRPKADARMTEGIDQIIVGTNKIRTKLNSSIRLSKGFTEPLKIGEKIIVLQNNSSFGVFNGQIFYIDEIRPAPTLRDWRTVKVHDELGVKHTFSLWLTPFISPEIRDNLPRIPSDNKRNRLVYADYGYVITCHKSQGSEWDNVVLFDQWVPPKLWDVKRWRYTGITRAAKQLTIYI